MEKIHLIKAVKRGSIAEELEVLPGDALIKIDDNYVEDILEYKYMINDYYIEVLIKKASGEEWLLEVEKEPYEDLGLVFERELMGTEKSCVNKCIFCFIDQLPRGMRKSLYFKDDDSRLSFLQGNFISLTNLEAADIERIITYRISPLNISVHTTIPDLRVQMLGNPKAGNALGIMRKFLDKGLTLNCQIVLCPGINDGINFERTLRDLSCLGPNIKSIGVVPVGITKHREGLFPLKPFEPGDAADAVNIVEKWQRTFQRRYKSRVVYASDELYLKAGLSMPPTAAYEGFPQLENGVGMMALFQEQFERALNKSVHSYRKPNIISIATGVAAADFIKRLRGKIKMGPGHKNVLVYPIANKFLGETIDVSGLVTGGDLIAQLRGKELGRKLIIPENMLKSGEEIFLDDVSVSEVSRELNIEVEVCPVEGKMLFKKLTPEDI